MPSTYIILCTYVCAHVCRRISSVSVTCDSPAYAVRCTRRRFTAHYRFHTLASRSIRRAEPRRDETRRVDIRSGIERSRRYRVPYRYVTPHEAYALAHETIEFRSWKTRARTANDFFPPSFSRYLRRLPPVKTPLNDASSV